MPTRADPAIAIQRVEKIAAFVSSPGIRAAVLRAAGTRYEVHFCSDEAGLLHAASNHEFSFIVWDLVAGADRMISSISTAMERSGHGSRLFVAVDLSRQASRQLCRLADDAPHATVALLLHDDIAFELARWLGHQGEAPAYPSIVKRLRAVASPDRCDIACAAAFAGRRHCSAGEFAIVCGTPLRTLEWRAASFDMPTPSHLLGLMITLHTAWRLDVLGWVASEASSAGGFGKNSRALSKYIARHMDVDFDRLGRAGTFDVLLEEVSTIIAYSERHGK